MLRFAATAPDGRRLVGLGITAANVRLLTQGKPIHVSLEDYGITDAKVDIMLFYGETLEALQAQVAPMIDKETQIHVDPLLAAAPEDARTKKDGQNRGKI